jgi:hypothetical protein
MILFVIGGAGLVVLALAAFTVWLISRPDVERRDLEDDY